jgi:hypothetical protein
MRHGVPSIRQEKSGTGWGSLPGFSPRLTILAVKAVPAQITQRSDRCDQQNPTDGA